MGKGPVEQGEILTTARVKRQFLLPACKDLLQGLIS